MRWKRGVSILPGLDSISSGVPLFDVRVRGRNSIHQEGGCRRSNGGQLSRGGSHWSEATRSFHRRRSPDRVTWLRGHVTLDAPPPVECYLSTKTHKPRHQLAAAAAAACSGPICSLLCPRVGPGLWNRPTAFPGRMAYEARLNQAFSFVLV